MSDSRKDRKGGHSKPHGTNSKGILKRVGHGRIRAKVRTMMGIVETLPERLAEVTDFMDVCD